MATTIDEIPDEKLQAMKKKVIDQLNSMNNDELKIALDSKQSLANVIARLFKEIAYALGYLIALPIAYAARIAESIWEGFGDGFSGAFTNVFNK